MKLYYTHRVPPTCCGHSEYRVISLYSEHVLQSGIYVFRVCIQSGMQHR